MQNDRPTGDQSEGRQTKKGRSDQRTGAYESDRSSKILETMLAKLECHQWHEALGFNAVMQLQL